jgi:hypothetical protein
MSFPAGGSPARALAPFLALLLALPAGSALAENFTSNVVDGVVSNFGGANYTLGSSGTGNVLQVIHGGVFSNMGSFTIGSVGSAVGNSALVSGPGSILRMNAQFLVANYGTSNSVVVSSNGQVVVGTGAASALANTAGSQGSILLDSGGTLIYSGTFNVGNNGGQGTLTLTNGNILAPSGLITLGLGTAGVGALNLYGASTAVVSTVHVGGSAGSTGSIVMAGGVLGTNSTQYFIGSSGNGSMLVSGGSVIGGSVNFGYNTGSKGQVSLLGGTINALDQLSIGGFAGATGLLTVAGGTLITSNNAINRIGNAGYGSLVVSNGLVLGGGTVIAGSGASVGSMLILGGTNQYFGNLAVGQGGGTGVLSVAAGWLGVTNGAANASLTLGAGLAVYTQTAGNVVVDKLTMTSGSGNVFAFNGGTFTINNGSTLSTSYALNLGGSSGSAPFMTVLGGTNSWQAGANLGGSSGATGTLSFAGGILAMSNNLGNATFTVGNGGLGVYTQGAGAAVANRLVATNGANSVFALNGGTFTVTSGSWVNAAGPLSIGAVGGSSAMLALLGLTNAWSNGFSLADAAGSTGTLILAGGGMATPSNAVVGNLGIGALIVSNGGFKGQGLVLGNSAGAMGTFTIAGGTNSLTGLSLGAVAGATGVLNVAGGTFALTNAAGNLVLNLGQAGFGVYTQTAGNVTLDRLVATNGANGIFFMNGGTLTVNQGMAVDTGSPFNLATSAALPRLTALNLLGGTNSFASTVLLGGSVGSTTGLLSLAGGVLTITNAAGDAALVVGQAGLGIYTQLAGGVTVDRLVATNGANSLFSLYGGTFSILHGSTANTSIVIGRLAGSEATMTLAGGSNQWSSGFTLGAGAGSTGRLVIANGATFSAGSPSLLVGSNAVGSLLTTNATLVAGSMTVGSAAGSMGSWTSLGASNRLTSTFTVASAAGSTGVVLLVNSWSSNSVVAIGGSGAGSLVSSNSTFLAGSMNVGQSSGSSGSWIDVGGSNAIQGPFFIAGGIGARGAVTLSNSFTSVGSALTMSSGTGSTGTLVVLGGTFLVPNGLEIARGIGALGQIFLDGGATFVLTNEITEVGVRGSGLLAVSNATYLARDATFGSNAASVGTMSIAGGDTRFGGDVILGYKAGSTGYVNFSSGLFSVTNAAGTAGLVVGRTGFGAYQQDGGDAIVDRLVATNGANSVFAFNGATFTVLHGATVANGQALAIGTNGPAASTMRLLGGSSSLGDLLVGGYGTLLVSNATLDVAGWVTNSGTLKLDRATVTFQKPASVDGGLLADLSTATFKSNLAVGASGWLASSTGGTFALEKDFVMQSTNLGQFNLAYSSVLFTNGPGHVLDLSGSGAKDKGAFTNFADVANNFAIGQLNLGFGDTLTLTGTKSGALTNALYVGAFGIQGLGSAPYLTNSFLDVSNTLASILSLPNVNLYFDPTDPRNDWLVNNMPDGGYNFWGGGSLSGASLLSIPEPSPAALALAGAALAALLRRRARGA